MRWAGNRLTVSRVGDRLNSRPTPRPPQGGSEESERRISFQQPEAGCGWFLREEFHHGFRSCRAAQRTPGRPGPARFRGRARRPDGKATLTAISNTRRVSGDNRGEEATAILWTLWGKQAENAAQYLAKGSHVNVVGRVQNNNYQRDGETVYSMAFTAEEIDYLDTKHEGDALRARQGTGPDERQAAPQTKPATAKAAKGRKAPARTAPAELDEHGDPIPF